MTCETPWSAENWSAHDWAGFLSQRLGAPVEIEFGRSRRYPIQVWTRPNPSADSNARKRPARTWIVRLHKKIFLQADQPVCEALALWLRDGDKQAAAQIDAWLKSCVEAQPEPPRPVAIEPKGETYDLEALAVPLFERSFRGAFTGTEPAPRLTWGRRIRSRSRRSLRLGSYDPTQRLVRIHPVLDQEAVPAWFVRYILFHELLHAALPTDKDESGRWVHHPPQFRQLESDYPDYRRALAWEALNVPRLIRSAREGSPLRVLPRDRKALALDDRWDPQRCPTIDCGEATVEESILDVGIPLAPELVQPSTRGQLQLFED